MIEHFGTGVFACVMDSYDYAKALSEVLPSIAAKKVERGGYLVLRPDSGDPMEAVLMALVAADRVFGSDVNSKGYRVLRGCGVIQGDGIDIDVMRKIAGAIEAAGYAADNVAYGMGGGLLQKVVYDMGPLPNHKWDDFSTVRARVAQQWTQLAPTGDNISASLKRKIMDQMTMRGKSAKF
ncbi:uncharacterized protein HaLaN_13860, partial [Haematococcus lacustris]